MKNKVGTAKSFLLLGAMWGAVTAFGSVANAQQQGLLIGQEGTPQGSAPSGWQITPSISLRESYTDDVDLDLTLPQSDFVTTTTVGVTALRDGPRFELDLNYALNHLYYPSLDDDEFRHNLQLTSQTEAVRDLFFIDLAAGVNQQFIDRRDAFTTVDAARSSNRATVSVINVNPYLQHRVGGNFATVRTGYNYSYLTSAQNTPLGGINLGTNSAQFHSADFVVNSGTRFNRFTWNWNNTAQFQSTAGANDLDVYSTVLTLNYQLVREIGVFGSTGYTKRTGDFNNAISFDGAIWRIGTTLTPGPRTNVTISYGKEFFADTWDVDAAYQITPNLSITGEYNDRYQTFAQNVLQNFQNGGGNNVINQQFVNNQFSRFKNYQVALTGTRGRSTITVTAAYQDSTSQNVNTTFTRKSVSVSLGRQLSTRLTAGVIVNLMRDRFANTTQDDQFISGQFIVNYAVSQNLTASFEYIRTRREQALFNFVNRDSNYVSVTLGYTF